MQTTINDEPVLSPDGRVWTWPDGKQLYAVRGGSDAGAVDAPSAGEGDAGTPPADAPAGGPPVDDAGAPPAGDPPAADGDDFYAGWPEAAVTAHKSLKEENVRYKERFRPFEQTFARLHEDDAEFFRGFIDAVVEGDPNVVKQYSPHVRALLDKMSPADRAVATQAIEGAADAAEADKEFDPFDPKQVEELAEKRVQAALEERDRREAAERAERERKAAVDAATAQIVSAAATAAEEHGIPEWADPTSGLYAALVSVAHRNFPGETTVEARIAKAAEALSGEFDRRSQALLQAKVGQGSDGRPAPQQGEPPNGQKVPTTLDEASESAMKRLEALQRGPG